MSGRKRPAAMARGLALLAVLGALGATPAAPADEAGNAWIAYAPDPVVYSMGWSTAHWASGIGRMLVWGGHSHNYRGNNSLRAFDPVTNTWEVLTRNDKGGACRATTSVQNRDNHVSFYVPARGAKGEFWVLGGAFTSTFDPECNDVKGSNFGGRFDLAQRKWVNVAHSAREFADSVIADFAFRHVLAAARGWCTEIDSAVVFAGSGTNLVQIIEPNPKGPEPYRFWAGSPDGPHRRSQLQNNGVCVGKHFYVYGGHVSRSDEYLRDFWRLDVPARKWTRLNSPGVGLYQPVLTHDEKDNVLVMFGGSQSRRLFVYDLAADRWTELTERMRTFTDRVVGSRPLGRRNHVGAYAPPVGRHIYTGGRTRREDGKTLASDRQLTEAFTLSGGERR